MADKRRVLYVNENGDYREVNSTTDVLEAGGVEIAQLKLENGNVEDGYILVADADGYGTWKSMSSISGSATIGAAEDGSYTDGLFTDFNATTTPVGTAVDRFNEVLKALAPNPPASLSSMSMAQSGVSGKLSFGASNGISGYTNVGATPGAGAVDKDGAYSVSGARRGIFAPTAKSGTLADNQAASTQVPIAAYPANSFANGDQGDLKLYVNDVLVHTVTLSSFGGGASLSSGSGFNLSAATAIKFGSGADLDLFKYRTGTWTVSTTHQRNGWNYVRVIHTVNSVDYATGYFEWVNDAATDETVFVSPTLDGLSMSGSKHISGVEYHTSGTAQYDVTIQKAYWNTYSDSASAISFTGTNCSSASQTLPAMTSDRNDVILTNKSVAVTASGRLLGDDITVVSNVDRTVQSDTSSASAAGGYKILLDGLTAAATGLVEDFRGETYRIQSDVDIASTTLTDDAWDSVIELSAATSGYTDGLLIFKDQLIYPTKADLNGGIADSRFDEVTNGPVGNPNYSNLTGERVYLRYFDVGSSQNYRLNISATSTSFVAASNRGSLSGSNCTLELLAPAVTVNGSNVVEWKDCVTAYTTDNAVGCYASTYGATIPTSWGVTLGTKSAANSGQKIVIRFTAPASWTGNLEGITLTILG